MKKHVVSSGDTLETLSALYGIPICMIVKKNGTSLKNGKVIYIPDLDMCSVSDLITTMNYTVQKGDTVYSIAQKFNTSMEMIMRANSAKAPEDIVYGMNIKVPCNENKYLVYSVRMTETIDEIAVKFGVSKKNLIKLNRLKDNTSLYQGMQLLIPVGDKNAKTYTNRGKR